jgi:hypothetical protein
MTLYLKQIKRNIFVKRRMISAEYDFAIMSPIAPVRDVKKHELNVTA